MSEKLESLLPCPCGLQAELHEWEEIDATRWAARAKCNCGWEGPIGYADNRRGCFDAVNDLHKKRAITAWNKRAPKADPEPANLEAALKVYEDAACQEIYKMREGVAAVLKYAQSAGINATALTELRDEMLREAAKTDSCYTCYTDQAAYIARRLTKMIEEATNG
jgi:hypothetical protein